MLLHLVRHGSVGWVTKPGDHGLDETGRAQARLTRDQFASRHGAGRTIVAVYASPLRRAQQTATVIASGLELPIVTEVRLRELMNWGDVPGQTWEEFETLWRQCVTNHDHAPPGGSPTGEVIRRFGEWVAQVGRVHPSGDVVAVSHGGVLTEYVLGVADRDHLRALNPDFPDAVPNCSITTLRLDGDEVAVVALASTDHLSR
jgi:broad specificity phosphatase PhoE